VNYHPDDFFALIQEAESQGGAHVSSEPCKPTTFRLDQPIDPDRPRGPKRSQKFQTAGCHRRAKFLLPMLPEAYFDGKELVDWDETSADEVDFDFDDDNNPMLTMSTGEPALTKVCAVDDAMGLWPRFQDTMTTGQSFQE
jgi:hypothetical protein